MKILTKEEGLLVRLLGIKVVCKNCAHWTVRLVIDGSAVRCCNLNPDFPNLSLTSGCASWELEYRGKNE